MRRLTLVGTQRVSEHAHQHAHTHELPRTYTSAQIVSREKRERRGMVYVRRSKLVTTHTRRRLYVLFLGGVCEEINAGWDTRRRMYVLWVGGVCEEIELGVLRVR